MKILLLPSAKLITEELQNKFGKIPPVLIPVGKGTILDEIYNRDKDKYDKIIVIGKKNISLIQEYIDKKKYNIELIEVDELNDIGYSVFYALNNIDNIREFDEIVVNFGDTLSEYSDSEEKNIIYFKEVSESDRWTIFKKDGNDLLIHDKKELDDEYFNAFIGIFKFSNAKLLLNILRDNINSHTQLDTFYYSIKKYNEFLSFDIQRVEKWFDLGHEDNYNNSKKDVQARYFNTIDINRNKGMIKKYSEEVEKFRNEILWYLKLPNTIQYLAPRVFDYSIDYNNMYINMEYYGYTTIHELFMYGELNKSQWRNVYNSIFLAIEDMKAFTEKVDKDKLYNTLNEMYYVKTIERLNKLRQEEKFINFFNEEIVINDIKYKSLNYYINNLKDILKKNGIYELEKINIIHGDLCFANILYDLNSGIIRLIDPRGKFGEYDIYGDYRYDLAKISHSVNGKYDYIINDLFDISETEEGIKFNLVATENSKLSEKIFYEYLSKEEKNKIQLIEALLFLSMIPLHKDYPERQLAMMCTGIQLINKYV